jgi:predicted nuclease with TOPRIM domain
MQSKLEHEVISTINRLRRLGIHISYDVTPDTAHIVIKQKELIDAIVRLSLKDITYPNKDAYYVDVQEEYLLIRVSKKPLEPINLEGFNKIE